MRKRIIGCISILMALVMSVSAAIPAAASIPTGTDMNIQTDCGGDCDYCPTIVVPGILQSQVYLQNEDGTDMLASDGKPIMEAMDMKYFVDSAKFGESMKGIIAPALGMMLTGNDCGLTKKLTGIMNEQVSAHYFNPDGTRNTPISVQDYWYSVEESGKYLDKFGAYTGKTGRTQMEAALREVNVSEYGEIAGYDHLYFFCYESFGNIYNIASRFNDYIQMVKAQTGHDKVNLVFISLGGAVGTAYLDEYFNENDINRIVFVAAALNGTTVMSDCFRGNFTLTDFELLYSDFVPSILSMLKVPQYEWLGYLASILLRVLPHERLECLQNVMWNTIRDTLVKNMFANCSTMWSLIPSEEYPALAQKYISDEAHAPLKAVTDKYYRAQCNNKNTIRHIADTTDVQIFNICGYGLDIPAILGSYYTETSDNIINTSSTSMGAKVCAPGTTLPSSYVPAIDESYISPDRMIDAGAGYLPNQTWYVYGQSHLKLQSSKDVIHMCVRLLADKTITDCKVNNGGYAQFNAWRNSDDLQILLNRVGTTTHYDEDKLNAANPTEAQRKEFIAAFTDGARIYNSTVWNKDECDKAIRRLYNIMKELGLDGGLNWGSDEELAKQENTKQFFSRASEIVYKIFGARSFWIFF